MLYWRHSKLWPSIRLRCKFEATYMLPRTIFDTVPQLSLFFYISLSSRYFLSISLLQKLLRLEIPTIYSQIPIELPPWVPPCGPGSFLLFVFFVFVFCLCFWFFC